MAVPPVSLGAAIFALHDPHRGHEAEFNQWYERDHMYAGGVLAPWTIGAARWVATAALKKLRYPDPGPFGPAAAGSFLASYWIQHGHLEEQQQWVATALAELGPERQFGERDVQTATTYDVLGVWERDADGVPPFLALAHGYPGLVWVVAERAPSLTLDTFAGALIESVAPSLWAESRVAMAVACSPRAKEPWWPAAAPEVTGVGERVMLACFVESDPREVWDELFVPLGRRLSDRGLGRALLVAPFVAVVPGTDRYVDELW
jgi:hypothetical protein